MANQGGFAVDLSGAAKESEKLASLFSRAHDARAQQLATSANDYLSAAEAALAQYYGAEQTLTNYLAAQSK